MRMILVLTLSGLLTSYDSVVPAKTRMLPSASFSSLFTLVGDISLDAATVRIVYQSLDPVERRPCLANMVREAVGICYRA